MRRTRVIGIFAVYYLCAISFIVALFVFMGPTDNADAASEPQPGTVQGYRTYTFLAATGLTTGTTATDPDLTIQSVDPSLVAMWNSADVFVEATLGETSTLQIIPRYSPDNGIYQNALFDTVDLTGTIHTHTYSVTMSETGNGYMRLPIVGEYLDFEITVVGAATPTIKVTLRNN